MRVEVNTVGVTKFPFLEQSTGVNSRLIVKGLNLILNLRNLENKMQSLQY